MLPESGGVDCEKETYSVKKQSAINISPLSVVLCSNRGEQPIYIGPESFIPEYPGENNANLNCTYQKKTFYNFVWFKQEPGKGLVSLSLIQSSQKKQADKNFKELLGKEKFYSLPPWRLSYLLLCFASQCSRSTCSLSHNCQLGLLTGV